MQGAVSQLAAEIAACRLCADRFAQTATAHSPHPVPWLSDAARILICGQAPGARVHASGTPFDDPSGDRLRNWLGVDRATFYARSKFAILPMAFCFPGYSAKKADLPPPAICAKTWRSRVLEAMPQVELTLLVGGYAQKWHLRDAGSVTDTVANWRECRADMIPLPHPSWRNTAWIAKNPWFERELIPHLRKRIKELLDG